MVLQDPNIKGLLNQFIEDTQQGVDDPNMAAAEVLKNSDSTDEMMKQAVPELTVENIFGSIMNLVPEDSPANDFFGFFTQGDMNDGMNRRGSREDEEDEEP